VAADVAEEEVAEVVVLAVVMAMAMEVDVVVAEAEVAEVAVVDEVEEEEAKKASGHHSPNWDVLSKAAKWRLSPKFSSFPSKSKNPKLSINFSRERS
jgi:hypothetical protein